MRNYLPLTILLLVLLQGCATAPSGPVVVQAVCPALPPLEQAAPEPSFTERMQSFLRGSLPALTGSDYSFPNAKLSTQPPAKQSSD